MPEQEHVSKTTKLLTLTAVIAVCTLIFGFYWLGISTRGKKLSIQRSVLGENQQTVNIKAFNGYSPAKVEATAGVPTLLRVTSENSYGCESSLVIPELGISRQLSPNGVFEVDLGVREKGEEISGYCSMGMYKFDIYFK